mgnify:CR=1 FL=1
MNQTTSSSSPTGTTRAIRGRVLHFQRDPQFHDDAYQYWEDGVLLVADGRIAAVGPYAELAPSIAPGTEVIDHRGKLIVPGFIDTHVHYPQTDMIASPSPGLLHWLDTYTFPEERRFAEPDLRQEIADDVETEALAGLVGLADAHFGQQVLDDMAEAPARLRASPATLRGEGALNRGVGVRRHGIIMTVRRDIRGSVDCRRIVSIIRLEDKLRVTRNLLRPVLAQPFAPWPRA